MTNALADFSLSGVDFVHIMLGGNDAYGDVTSGSYKANMQTIIDILKSAGIRQILVSNSLYVSTNDINS